MCCAVAHIRNDMTGNAEETHLHKRSITTGKGFDKTFL